MIRDLAIDADHIIFSVTESKTYKNDELDEMAYGDDFGVVAKLDLKPMKKHFMSIINEYILQAEVESICYGWTVGKVRIIMSDKTNFRYEIYPEYKAKRPSSSEARKKLAKWARKKFQCEPNTEADDVVAHYVRKGAIGVTTDKDLLYGVAGIWYNSHYMHQCFLRTNEKDAEFFFKQQVLAGDGVDGIPSIKGVGMKTAKTLLEENGDTWADILHIFLDKGHDKRYMETMTRLVCMTQWTPKKGIKLWKFPKK